MGWIPYPKKAFPNSQPKWLWTSTTLSLLLASCLQTREEIRKQQGFQSQPLAMKQAQASPEEYSEQMRELRGRIEELEVQLRETQKRQLTERNQQENVKLAELERRIQALIEELREQKETLAALRAQWEDWKSQQVKEKSEEGDPFQRAEELFKQGDFRKAILSYQKFREQNPKSSRYIEATYKMAVAFDRLGMKNEAVSFFEEVVEKAPRSPEAQKAKIRLKKLKGS